MKTDLKAITGFRLEALTDPKLPAQGPGASENGNFVLTEFRVATASEPAAQARVGLSKAAADFAQDQFPVANAIDGRPDTGWAIYPHVGKAHTATFEVTNPIPGGPGTTLVLVLDFQSQYPKHQIGKFRLSTTTSANPCGSQGLPPNVRAALAVAAEKRNDAQRKEIAAFYRSITPALAAVRTEIAALEQKKAYLLRDTPTCLVSISTAPRTVRIYPRGNWLDDSGPVVQPAVPPALDPAAGCVSCRVRATHTPRPCEMAHGPR